MMMRSKDFFYMICHNGHYNELAKAVVSEYIWSYTEPMIVP